MVDRAAVEFALREVIDPELGLDVVSLGLVYRLEVVDGEVAVDLTMTTPACPLGEQIVRDAEAQLAAVPGVTAVRIALVWEPPWSPERMSDQAKEELGWGW